MGFMKLLIAHGARIDSEDEDGDTALHAVLKKYQLVSAIAGRLVGVESTPDITEVRKKYTYLSNLSRDSIRTCFCMWYYPRLMTMSPLYPCGIPCSRGTHNETVKNLALSPAFDHDSIDRISIERLP